MKVVLCMRSDAAYGYVSKAIQLSSKLIEIKIPKENVDNLELLDDYVAFYEADLYIIDKAATHSKEMIQLIEQNELEPLIIEDIKIIVELLENKYGIKEVQQNFKSIQEVKEKTEVESKIIEKEVYISKYQAVPHRLILIGSLYSNAGSTIVGMNFARMIAERGLDVTYIENPLAVPRMYDYLQITHRTDNYVDIAQEIKNGFIPDITPYRYKGVQWIVNDPNKQRIKSFSFEEYNLLQQITRSTITILDVSNYYHEPEVIKLAQIADEVILVMEANPIKNEYHILNPNRDENVFVQFENNRIKYKILLTKTNIKGLDIKTVKEMLPQRSFLDLPYIKYEYLVKNLFETKIFYDDQQNQGQDFIEKYLINALALILPKQFIPLKEEKSLLSKFLKRG